MTRISNKYQIVIPKEVRQKLRLRCGQKMCFVVKAGIMYLIPQRPLSTYKGFVKLGSAVSARELGER
ncbi:MAG: AbrB/MazE/SpoVT family DNA-binding domain-containing protein [Nitrospirota bacterium]